MIRNLFLISRPRFWLYLLGPFLVGFAAGAENRLQFLSPPFWYGFFFFMIPANIFLYGVNDFFDRDTDFHNEKKGTKEYRMKETEQKFYMRIVLFSFLFSFPLFIVFDLWPRLILILFFLLSFFYSAPPLRFKAKPFVDFISNFLYVLPGVMIYQHLTAEAVPWSILVAAGCWTGAMHLYSAVPDIEADKKVKLVTTAVLLGKRKSIILCIGLWSFTAFIASGFSPLLSIMWVYPLLTALAYSGVVSIQKLYWYFPRINAVLGFILFWYVILS